MATKFLINWKTLTTVWATLLLLVASVSLGITLVGTIQTFTMLHETSYSLEANAASEALPKSLVGVHRIVCVGDSITHGEGRGYVVFLQQYLNALYPQAAIVVENMGVPGSSSADLLKTFQASAVDHHPDLITIDIGVNDVWFNKGALTPSEYAENMSRILDLAEKAKVPVILLSPTPIGEDLTNKNNKLLVQYIQALELLAQKRHVPFINNYAAFSEVINAYHDGAQANDNVLTIDGTHPNRLGHRILANKLMMYLGIPATARLKVKADAMTEMRN